MLVMVIYKFYIINNSNHVGSKIVKVEPFGFIEVSKKFAFFVVRIKLDTLILGDVNENHITIHLKMVQLWGFAKEVLVWAHIVINMGWKIIFEVIDGVHNLLTIGTVAFELQTT